MRLRTLLVLPGTLLLAPLASLAADNLPDGDMKIQGVFDSNLPGTERKHSLRFIFHPRIGDLHRYDYLRIPAGLRYGLSNRWELLGEVEGYFAHGLGDAGWFEEAGFSEVHFGTKYRLSHDVYGWDSAIGMDYSFPLGSPPTQITDGLRHLTPYVTFSRRLEAQPQWRLFWGVGADMVSTTGTPGRIRKNRFDDDSMNVTGGFVWEHGALNYTLEAGFATTRVFGGKPEDVFSLRPGIIWAVPTKLTTRVGGQWVLGFGLHSTFGPDGTDIGGSLKARVSVDFKRWLRRRREAP